MEDEDMLRREQTLTMLALAVISWGVVAFAVYVGYLLLVWWS